MRVVAIMAGLGLAMLAGGTGIAAEVKESVEIAAAPDKVWAAIGDFCGISQWHPVIAGCEVTEVDGKKVRTLTTKDGGKFVEPLDAWDDAGRSYTYRIQESPLPVKDYVSTIKVAGEGDTSTVEWSSKFEPSGASEADAMKAISGVYKAGFEGLQKKF